jgi:hypothetical protein
MDWNNFDNVLAAVKIKGYAIEYADEALKGNYEIVLARCWKPCKIMGMHYDMQMLR